MVCPVACCASTGPAGQELASTRHRPGDALAAAPGQRGRPGRRGEASSGREDQLQARAGTGPRLDLQPKGARSGYSLRCEEPGRSSILSARGADHRKGDRPAVRMDRARAGGPAAGLGAIGHRCRQVQPGRGDAIRQGRDADHFRARAVSRTPGQQRTLGKDGERISGVSVRCSS